MREVLHGDRVIVRIAGSDRRGRPEGKIVEILERGKQRIVGRVLEQHGVLVVVPEDRASPGHPARASLAQRAQEGGGGPGGHGGTHRAAHQFAQPIGKIVEVLGNYADSGMEIEIALRKHDLPFEFSSEAKEQARKLPVAVRKKDLAGREDIRHLPLVTIDGETARDFDDAGMLRTPGARVSADRGDCRRVALRRARFAARSGVL